MSDRLRIAKKKHIFICINTYEKLRYDPCQEKTCLCYGAVQPVHAQAYRISDIANRSLIGMYNG